MGEKGEEGREKGEGRGSNKWREGEGRERGDKEKEVDNI